MRSLLTALCALSFTLSTSAEPLTVTIAKDAVACDNFMGFGVEWDPKFWTMGTFKYDVDPKAVTVTEADWDLVVKRIRWMRIPIMRLMMQWRWCTNGDGKFDWDTPHMKSLYRHLDVCEKEGIKVVLTEWIPGWWEEGVKPGFKGVDDPQLAEAIGVYMDQLVNTKKYTCIKYFVFINEPNFSMEFPVWKKGVLNVAGALAKHGVDKKVTFAGPDESTEDHGYFYGAVNELQSTFGAYEFHVYAGNDGVNSGGYERGFAALRDFVSTKDPNGKSKPVFLGEAGVKYAGFNASNNQQHENPVYGLAMADLAAQASGAGFSTVLAWMLDDSSHEAFNWGMWKNKTGGYTLKPWFYTWSLLSRYVPAGSTTFRSGIADPTVRVLAARSNDKSAPGWTFAVINRAYDPRTVKLVSAEAGSGTIQYFLYAKDKNAADKDGFPIPAEKKPGDFAKGVELTLPPESAYVLTTIDLK